MRYFFRNVGLSRILLTIYPYQMGVSTPTQYTSSSERTWRRVIMKQGRWGAKKRSFISLMSRNSRIALCLQVSRERENSLEHVFDEGKRIPTNCGSKGRVLSNSDRIALLTFE